MRVVTALVALVAPALALWLLLCLGLWLVLGLADVLSFALLHADLPDACRADGAGFWLCF